MKKESPLEELEKDLEVLESTGSITTEESKLRSKLKSVIRTIEDLEAKRLRITFELKQQKKALARKRNELKKFKKHSQTKVKAAIESNVIVDSQERQDPLRSIDDALLQQSAQLLKKLESEEK